MNKCELVKKSCSKVVQKAKHIKLNAEKLSVLAEEILKTPKYIPFDEFDCHLSAGKSSDSIMDYLFVLDSLNFCFWRSNWEYDNLAGSLKNLYMKDPLAFKPKGILQWDLKFLKEKVFGSLDFPLLEERLRILHEISEVTIACFGGEFSNVVKAAENSAVKLVFLLTSHFNNFQDHSLYDGEQICFYKRSQILVGDLWGALKNKPGFEDFLPDISQLTTFPDYRVPQILNHLGVLEYSQELKEMIDKKIEIPSGSQHEMEIRAFTVEAVERLKKKLNEMGCGLNSVEIDWFLWQKGEKNKEDICNHHRTMSIFY